MITLSSNTSKVISSLITRASSIILTFALTPIYIKYLGKDAYGLIAISLLTQSIIMLFEFGLPLTLTRSISKLRSSQINHQKISNLLKSFEILFYLLSFIVVLTGILFLWIKPSILYSSELNDKVLNISLILIFSHTAIRLPLTIYQSGIRGFEKIIELNLLSIIFIIIKFGGNALLLIFFDINIIQFFFYQFIIQFFELIFMRQLYWNMPGIRSERFFSIKIIFGEIKFAKVAFISSIIGIFLIQFDRIILTAILSLEEFGMYNIMVMFGAGIAVIGYPIGTVAFPSFSKYVQEKKLDTIKKEFEEYLNFNLVFILPLGLFLFTYTNEIMYFYLGQYVSIKLIEVMPIYFLGSIFTAMIPVLNSLVLSSNQPQKALNPMIIMGIFYIPILPMLINFFGLLGACVGFFLLQFGMFLFYSFEINLIFKNVKVHNILIKKIFLPGIILFLFYFIAKFFFSKLLGSNVFLNLLYLFLILFLAQIITIFYVSIISFKFNKFNKILKKNVYK